MVSQLQLRIGDCYVEIQSHFIVGFIGNTHVNKLCGFKRGGAYTNHWDRPKRVKVNMIQDDKVMELSTLSFVAKNRTPQHFQLRQCHG